MGLFKGIGNFFKSKVGKLLTGIGAVLAAPFTAGASLAAVPFLLKGKKKTGEPPTILSQIEQPIESKRVDIPPPQIFEPVIERQPSSVLVNDDGGIEERVITSPKKTDVTLFGFYSEINKITIPVDNDLDNVVIVPNTFFPYIVEFDNHPPSKGIRYISEFVFQKLLVEWETNLGKVLNTLEDGLSIYPYIKFDWQIFVDKYNNFNAGFLERDGGIMFGFTLSPVFLLQWVDGPEPANLLDYSYKIPPAVRTVDDLNPQEPTQPNKIPSSASSDPKKFDRLSKIIDTVTKVGTTFALAKAGLGTIKSIYGNTKNSINNLKDTAAKLQNKFKDLKGALSKDAINGKINSYKNLIKKNLPTPKNLKKKFLEENAEFITNFNESKKQRLERRDQRRKAKADGIKTKFALKNFKLPEIPELPTLPRIPQIPKNISLNTFAQLPGFGDVAGLVQQGKGIVSGVGNINFKDPLSLLNAPANLLNQVSGLGNSVAYSVGNAAENISKPLLDAKNAQEAALNKLKEDSQQMVKNILAPQFQQRNLNPSSIIPITPVRNNTNELNISYNINLPNLGNISGSISG